MASERDQLTDALVATSQGDHAAADQLMPLVYDRLKALAAQYMRGERLEHTLQPTALVHEAYLRMIDIDRIDWRGKTHFYAVAARQMRRILIDHARGFAAQKRADRAMRVTLNEGTAVARENPIELLALDEALSKLADLSPRQAVVVEQRIFAGMQVKEVAEAIGVSERTVKSDWRFARVWLMHELGVEPDPDSDES